MNKKDIYDIIIENAIKDWNNSMDIQDKRELWEVPKYSKSEINKAGSIIADPSSSKEDRDNALIILNNWRAAHAYPLHIICNNLRLRNPDALVVQRLKRLESITGKIERFPDMKLYRMQDLGGCRVIVDTIDQVYEAVNRYKKSRIRHIFKKEKDYIQEPKESGYRSYHMVYQFQSDKTETYNKNMLIEIQFRTKLQHIWATALETMSIYTKSQLKSSIGDKDVLRFFVLISSLFAKMEDMPICPNTDNNRDCLINEIRDINNKLNLLSKLDALSVVINKYTDENLKNKGYYLLRLNYTKKVLNVSRFPTNHIKAVTVAYGKLEELNDPDIDVVLVSATSFDSLKEAYPNYFTDISQFVDMMRRILE